MKKSIFCLVAIVFLFNSCIKIVDPLTNPPIPEFDFEILPLGGVQFIDKSKGAKTYVWDFGNGNKITELNPKINFLDNGTYNVKLTVSNDIGSNSISKQVIISNGRQSQIISDEWTVSKGSGGGYGEINFRNHVYEFEVTEDNKEVDFNAQSTDINIGLILYNNLWESIETKINEKNVKITKKLNKGIYRLMVYSGKRYDVGKYSLNIKGYVKPVLRIGNISIKDLNNSFGETGGGGYNYNDLLSPRNKNYTFEVTEDNTNIDIDIIASKNNIDFILYNNVGKSIANSYLYGRRLFTNKTLNKGIYTLYISTYEVNAKTDVSVEIFGYVKNLIEKKFFNVNFTDQNWSGNQASIDFLTNNDLRYTIKDNSSYDTYTFDITEDNSVLDVSSISASGSYLKIYDDKGISITSKGISTSTIRNFLNKMEKGRYKMYVFSTKNTSTDKYTIQITGMTANVKKI